MEEEIEKTIEEFNKTFVFERNDNGTTIVKLREYGLSKITGLRAWKTDFEDFLRAALTQSHNRAIAEAVAEAKLAQTQLQGGGNGRRVVEQLAENINSLTLPEA